MSKARMREIIRDQVTTSMNEFMVNMNRGARGAGAGGAGAGGTGAGGAGAGGAGAGGARASGAGAGGAGAGGAGAGGAGAGGAKADGAGIGGARPVEAKVSGCTYMTFMKCNPHTFKGTEVAVGLCDTDRTTTVRQNQRRAKAKRMTNAVPNDNDVCPKCKNNKHNGDCWKCSKCGKLGHKTAAYRCLTIDKKICALFSMQRNGSLKEKISLHDKEWSKFEIIVDPVTS
ncbi:hypothetical protein Tco_1554456 [Tanacetum coccineum]